MLTNKYCPIPAWKKAREKGLSPSEQIELGKEISKMVKGCNCNKGEES